MIGEVSSDGYRFFALDAKTGRLKFTLDAKGAVFSSPAVAGDIVYVGVWNGRLLAVDVKSGKLMWDFQTAGSHEDVEAGWQFEQRGDLCTLFW